jgi:hypothetical protein
MSTDLGARKNSDEDDDDKHKKEKDSTRRKSTIIILSCDNEPLALRGANVVLSFAGALDECAYFFEAKSAAACAGIETTPSQLGPSGVFGVMYVESSYTMGRILTNRGQNADCYFGVSRWWLRISTDSHASKRVATTTKLLYVGGYLWVCCGEI